MLKYLQLIGFFMLIAEADAQTVGIGSASFTAASTLEIRGAGNTASDSVFHIRNSSGTSLLFVNGAGNVGINSRAPGTKLEVSGSEANNTVGAGAAAALKIINTNIGAVGRLSEIQFGISSTTKFAAISGYLSDASNNTRGDILFSTRNVPTDANLTERMRINGSGNVGIGTTNPSAAKLEISGSSGATLRIVDGNQGSGKVLVSDANGVASWQATTSLTGAQSQSIYFSSSSSWTVPTGVTLVWITMWGGGGGGGGTGAGSILSAGGGGGGEIIYRYPLNVTPATSLTFTIGNGGSGGTAGNNVGSAGISTTLTNNGGNTLTAKGGGGGGANSAPSSGEGGTGGGVIGSVGTVPSTSPAPAAAGSVVGPWLIGGTAGGGAQVGGYAAAGGSFSPNAGGTVSAANNGGGGGGAGFGLYNSTGNGGAGGTAGGGAGNSASANSGAGGGGAAKSAGSAFAGGNGGSGGLIIEWIAQ